MIAGVFRLAAGLGLGLELMSSAVYLTHDNTSRNRLQAASLSTQVLMRPGVGSGTGETSLVLGLCQLSLKAA